MDLILQQFYNLQELSYIVLVGKIAVVAAMVLGIVISPFLGIDKKGGFQFIQEYTGFVSPGIFAMFILGFFWKKATSNAALFATIGGFIMSVILKLLPHYANLGGLIEKRFPPKEETAGSSPVPGVLNLKWC